MIFVLNLCDWEFYWVESEISIVKKLNTVKKNWRKKKIKINLNLFQNKNEDFISVHLGISQVALTAIKNRKRGFLGKYYFDVQWTVELIGKI